MMSFINGELFAFVVFVFWAVIHITFCAAVYKDASKINAVLVEPSLWALITLIGGPIFAGVYWIINRLPLSDNFSSDTLVNPDPYNTAEVENKLKNFKSKFNAA